MKKLIDWIWWYLKDIVWVILLFIAIAVSSAEDLGCNLLGWLTPGKLD
jgi:hypothetical protein